MKKNYLFTSEAVSEGHPDKVADQISDAILDAYLDKDPEAHVACETLVTTNTVVLAGEITSSADVSHERVVREVIREIGYTEPGMGFSANQVVIHDHTHRQSPDINQGVNREDGEQGAGDQGIMFGYATKETEELMPVSWYLANEIVKKLSQMRKSGLIKHLRPDSKAQVTIEYRDGKPAGIDTIVVSTQHEEFDTDEKMHEYLERELKEILMPAVIEDCTPEIGQLFKKQYIKYYINPTGRFVIGGPAGDTGLTGRKIIVDTYGGRGAHGGGAFSGKDPSKVDRSGAYIARHIAKLLVATGFAEECLVQLGYAIGIAEPVSININTFGTGMPGIQDEDLETCFPKKMFTPHAINEWLDLKKPIYKATSCYGHFGNPEFSWEQFTSKDDALINALISLLKQRKPEK